MKIDKWKRTLKSQSVDFWVTIEKKEARVSINKGFGLVSTSKKL